jgi:hypothetical protein
MAKKSSPLQTMGFGAAMMSGAPNAPTNIKQNSTLTSVRLRSTLFSFASALPSSSKDMEVPSTI